jgi:hypothetical protein
MWKCSGSGTCCWGFRRGRLCGAMSILKKIERDARCVVRRFFGGFSGPCLSPVALGVAAFCRFCRFLCVFSVLAYF